MNGIIKKVGYLKTNCCIVWDDAGNCAVIDPGDDAEGILQELRQRKLCCRAILLTHGHPDHTGALERLAAETGAPIHVGAADAGRLPVAADVLLQDGDTVQAGQLRFQVLATPGHTEGGVCYLLGDTLFSGDTLFCRSVGRTDFPGGDEAQLRSSLRRLAGLSQEDLLVVPGHEETTTLAEERRYNPYLK